MRKLSFGPNEPRVIQNPPEKSKKTSSLAGKLPRWPLALAVSRWFFLRFLVFSCCALRSFKVKFGGLDWAALKVLKVAFRAASHFAFPQALRLNVMMGEVHYPPVLAFLVFLISKGVSVCRFLCHAEGSLEGVAVGLPVRKCWRRGRRGGCRWKASLSCC